jgi:predicted amidohydrolase YtcJ
VDADTGREPTESPDAKGISRKKFVVGGAAAGAAVGLGSGASLAFAKPKGSQARASADPEDRELIFINGKIHTMDPQNRVVKDIVIRNGRVAEVGSDVVRRGKNIVDLKGKTVIPGIIDAHNHIVLVGNRPGHSIGLEHTTTIAETVAELQAFSSQVPAGELISCIGPISAMQHAELRLPNLTELDAVPRPVYIQAAQGGTRTNSAGKAYLESFGVGIVVQPDGVVTSSGLALQTLRRELLTPETRKRSALTALQYFTRLGITTHKDEGAFHSDGPSTGIASENTFTMHNPFLALHKDGIMPARLRIDFLHQDPASDPTLPTLSQRLKNSFQFFGDDWFRTGGIGEFTGGGVNGLRAIAAAGWRGEDHALSLNAATNLIALREQVHNGDPANGIAPIPLTDLRWVISHIPGFNADLINRFDSIGGGVLVGWGPTRGGTNVGPPYRLLLDHVNPATGRKIPTGWHSDGGDITVISPWLNLYTTITGRNLAGVHILGDQNITRWEALWLATVANKWFIREDEVGSLETGNFGDLVVLDRDFFTCPEEEIKRIQSVLTVVGGKVVWNTGAVKV